MTAAPKNEPEVQETPGVQEAAANAPTDELAFARELQDKIKKLEEDVASLQDARLRAVAETDNVRKRSQRDQEELSKYAVTNFARDMVSVLENLKRASESITPEMRAADGKFATLAEGVDLTLREMLGTFERYGIKRVDPMGEKFDHNFHQAIAQIEKNDVEAGTVIQVVQAGYVIADRLLRPAMVAVSKIGSGEPPKAVDTSA